MNLNELMQGPQPGMGQPMYPGGMGGSPQAGPRPMPPPGMPPQGGQQQIPPQMLQILIQKLMQSQGMGQGMGQQMQATPSEYEKWAAPGSIGTTPLNQIMRPQPRGIPAGVTAGVGG